MLALVASLLLAPPSGEAILAVDGLVIGSRVGGKWKAPDAGFARRHRSQGFYSFGLGTVDRRPNFYGLSQEGTDAPVNLASEEGDPDLTPALGGRAPKAPRRVRTLPGSPPYEGAARRFLASHGIPVAKARVTRVLKVDLDGDGTDETIVEASNGDVANEAPKGAYSLVLLRALKGTKVVETALDFYPKRPGGPFLKAITRGVADLDGDGRMEVVVGDTGIDEMGAILWGYRAGRATELLQNGSGV